MISIEHLELDQLLPYAKNSRTHTDGQVAQIAASIKEFGFTNPILIDENSQIIAGHGRLLGARKLSMETVPCIRLLGLTPTQKQALVIVDNKLAMNAGWDEALLATEINSLIDADYNIDVLGFSTKELKSLLEVEEVEGETDPDAVPDAPAVATSKKGDVWLMGNHRLMCGDSTAMTDVDVLMAGKLADLVWTDPPYNVAVDGIAGKIMNDDMSTGDFRDFLTSVYACYFAAMREGACIYVAHGESERAAFTDCLIGAGIKLSQVLIWVKQSATLSRQDFNWQHEPILYGWKEGKGHYFCGDFTRTTVIDDDLKIKDMKRDQLLELVNEMRNARLSTVVRYDRPTKSELHPTMKPVGLVQQMIKWSSQQTDIVLDLFGGSGTTMIACEKINRHSRLMELDGRFADVCVTRWMQFTGKEAILESNGKTFSELAGRKIL